ncbi:MAG TPA: hypothetical protein PLK15_04910 [Chitinophagales bacterium]|nr:hypothetical protein [Chitinophagales bacterium]
MMRFIVFISLLFISTTGIFAQNYNVNAYQFHQAIEEAQQNIGKEMYYYNQRATELNLKILKFAINKSVKFIDSLKVYNNETPYYNATKKLFAMYLDITDNDYVELQKIVENPDLEAKDFKTKKLKIFEAIKKKTAVVFPEFKEAQLQYCKKYGIKLDKQ